MTVMKKVKGSVSQNSFHITTPILGIITFILYPINSIYIINCQEKMDERILLVHF